jgi:hypothetical protein
MPPLVQAGKQAHSLESWSAELTGEAARGERAMGVDAARPARANKSARANPLSPLTFVGLWVVQATALLALRRRHEYRTSRDAGSST